MRRRHSLILEKPPTGRDSLGRPKGTWQKLDRFAGTIKTLSGNEAEKAHQLVATATHTVNVRFHHTVPITTKHRFRFGNRLFKIGWVDDVDEIKRELNCLVSEDLE